jgi:hypothetical protein
MDKSEESLFTIAGALGDTVSGCAMALKAMNSPAEASPKACFTILILYLFSILST